MKASELDHLGYITAIANVESILERGILSHARASRLPHVDISMPEVQDIRATKKVPGGMVLHAYACTYICARNVMLYKRCLTMRDELCVLRVDPAILQLPDVVISDHNAAASIAGFAPYPDGLEAIDRERVFATYWTHPGDPLEEDRHRKEMCAEVLVPHEIAPRFITGGYVGSRAALDTLNALRTGVATALDPGRFF